MFELPIYARNFVAATAFEVTCSTEQGDETLLVESRRRLDGGMLLFTVIGGQQVQAHSLHELLLASHRCVALTIPHNIRVLWNGVSKSASLLEVLIPTREPLFQPSVKLQLTFDAATYATETCDTLYDAIRELEDILGGDVAMWFQTCIHCNYSWPALYNPGWEDRNDYKCYRDTPEAHIEIRRNGKFASTAAQEAGDYYVDAFHTCAAWQRKLPLE